MADGWSGPWEGEEVSSGLSNFDRVWRTWNAVDLRPVPGLLADVGRDDRAWEWRAESVSCYDEKSVLRVRLQPADREERCGRIDVLQVIEKSNIV